MTVSLDVESPAVRIARTARGALTRPVLAASGRIFGSPSSTLRPWPVYFLGLNPGRSPYSNGTHDLLHVGEDLDRVANGVPIDHIYLDEGWKGRPVGGHPMQLRTRTLFRFLAAGDARSGDALLRATPVSNLIFVRSSDEAELKVWARSNAMEPVELADLCWRAFHAPVIEVVRPKIVLTHAIGLAKDLARKWGLASPRIRDSGWGGTLSRCYVWRLDEGPLLVAVPNLGRFDPGGPREPFLRALFEEFAGDVAAAACGA